MKISVALLNARHIGVRELREHLSKRLKDRKPLIVTEHGEPTKVILSYGDVLELVEILDELQDRQTLLAVKEGREAVVKGKEGIPVSDLFGQIRRARN